MDAGEIRDVKAALDSGIQVFSFATLVNSGIKSETQLSDPESNSIATICYTSGTTGNPKGAMITHRNVLVMLTGLSSLDIMFDENDVHLSYLPLAHIFERVVSLVMMLCGASIGFFHGNVQAIKDDLTALRPTFFISVPRLYQRFYDVMQAKIKE